MRDRRAVVALVVMVAAMGGGCGYGLAGTGRTVPEGSRSIGIRIFANRTNEEGLEFPLRQAIEEEFRRRGQLAVVDAGDADLILSGTVRRFLRIPVASTGFDRAVQYQGVLQVSVRLTERATRRLLYRNRGLQESQDFEGVSGLVVGASPRFQRHTMQPRDVANLTNVEVSESQRRQAMRDLVESLARIIYVQAMEGF